MGHICELQTVLEQYFDWNKARLAVLANLLAGLFMVKTVNLSDLAVALYSSVKISSNYKRIQRFFTWLISVDIYEQLVMNFVISI